MTVAAGLVESTLAEVCSLVTDGTHDTPSKVTTGFPLVKAKEITGGRIDFETCDQISELEHLRVIARSRPQFGDTLFAHIGASLGEAAFVNTSREFSIKNIALFKPNLAIIDARYLYYLVISPAFQRFAKATKTGSAQPFLGLKQLREHPIRYHSELSVQRRIAATLSAYDELIENNQRRIRILEQMACALYREWFVEFRFPGHEGHCAVESSLGRIPQDWKVATLERLFPNHRSVVLTGPFGSKLHASDYRETGVPLLLVKHVRDGEVIENDLPLVGEHKTPELDRYRLKTGDIVVTRVGYVGDSAFVHARYDGWFFSGQTLRIRVPNSSLLNSRFLARYLQIQAKRRIQNIAVGATRPSLNTDLLTSLEFLLPPMDLQERFVGIVASLDNFKLSLSERNLILRRTRDLLLPRLMSGQLALDNSAA